MKKSLLFGLALLLAGSVFAADSNPKDDILAAAKALGEKANYSWKTTVTVPEDARWKPGPTEGKTEKDGYTHVKMSFGDNSMEAIMKGDKGAALTPDGGWQSFSELENAEGPGRFIGGMVRSFKNPADQIKQLAGLAKELKKDGDAVTGDLTEEGAKSLQTMRFGGGDGPTIANAKGSVKFWLKDGAVAKYEFKLKGTVSFNGNDFENDRTSLVEVKEVGTTKVSVPEEAKKKAS